MRKKETKLRAEKYKHIQAAAEAALQGQDIVKPFVLPSSFVDGERYMRQLYQVRLHAATLAKVFGHKQVFFWVPFVTLGYDYLAFTQISSLLAIVFCNRKQATFLLLITGLELQDAMARVASFGKPDVFITITCNANWPEVQSSLQSGQTAANRPDIIARVFKQKIKRVLQLLVDQGILGKVIALNGTSEFQKRGLPHFHLLLVLHEEDKPRGPRTNPRPRALP